MAGNIACPVCGHSGASYRTESLTLCTRCGAQILPHEARMLLVGPASYQTFCSPECLRAHMARDGLYLVDDDAAGASKGSP